MDSAAFPCRIPPQSTSTSSRRYCAITLRSETRPTHNPLLCLFSCSHRVRQQKKGCSSCATTIRTKGIMPGRPRWPTVFLTTRGRCVLASGSAAKSHIFCTAGTTLVAVRPRGRPCSRGAFGIHSSTAVPLVISRLVISQPSWFVVVFAKLCCRALG